MTKNNVYLVSKRVMKRIWMVMMACCWMATMAAQKYEVPVEHLVDDSRGLSALNFDLIITLGSSNNAPNGAQSKNKNLSHYYGF